MNHKILLYIIGIMIFYDLLIHFVWLFKKEDFSTLKRNLARCAPNDYFEQGIQFCIDEGTEVLTVPIENTAAVEVDFAEDLEKANSLIKRWQQGII